MYLIAHADIGMAFGVPRGLMSVSRYPSPPSVACTLREIPALTSSGSSKPLEYPRAAFFTSHNVTMAHLAMFRSPRRLSLCLPSKGISILLASKGEH